MFHSAHSRTKLLAGTLVMGGLIGMTACLVPGCAQAPPPQAGVTDVQMQNIAFVPGDVTIKQGESVRWTNLDILPHTSTSGNPGGSDAGAIWDSGFLNSGQSFTRQFNEVGEFVYFCRVHPIMMRDAKVIVIP